MEYAANMEYIEKQHLKLWWLYLLLSVDAVIVFSLVFLSNDAPSAAEIKAAYYLPIIAVFLPFLLVFLINKTRFKFRIDENGVSYSYRPFIRKKQISWTQIERAYLRRYDALGEYGGWGMRHRLWFKRKDKAYIFNDKNIGLQLEMKAAQKVLFSTNNEAELQLFLINLKRAYPIHAIETTTNEAVSNTTIPNG